MDTLITNTPIHIKINEDDIKDFHNHYLRHDLLIKIVVLLSVLFCIINLVNKASKENIVLVIIIASMFVFGYFFTRYRTLQLFRKDKNQQAGNSYLIDSENIVVTGVDKTKIIPRKDLYKVTQSKKCIFVWLNKKQAYIFPKRFLSEENKQLLLASKL